MPRLRIIEGTYYSQGDEAAFFDRLREIPGVIGVVGSPEGLLVTLRSKKLSNVALRELIALHFRYSLPMKELAQFETPKNKNWFRSRAAFWYAGVFGR